MLKKSKLAAAVVGAVVASTAFASAASANPIDLFTINSPGNQYQFGNGCGIGVPPTPSATLDWHNNANDTSGAPEVSGMLCVQNSTDETRVRVLYHDSAGGTITRFFTPSLFGTGGLLDSSVQTAGGPRINYQTLDHVHIEVVHRTPGGPWIVASSSTQLP